MRTMKPLLLALILSLATAFSAPAWATSALYLTTAEQAEQSSAVILATIGSQRTIAHPDHARPVTLTQVNVDEVLLGSAPGQLEVEQLGGTLDGRTLKIAGDAELNQGERVVLFVSEVASGWHLTAMQQSKYTVETTQFGTTLRRELSGGLFVRDEQGALVAHRAFPTKPFFTLDDMRRRLATVEVK